MTIHNDEFGGHLEKNIEREGASRQYRAGHQQGL